MRHAMLVTWMVCLLGTLARAEVKLTDKGWEITAGDTIGKLVMAYPQLKTGDKLSKPTEAKVEGNTVDLRYANGATLKITQEKDSAKLAFSAVPENVDGMKLEMPIPFALVGKANWKANDDAAQPLPAEYPGKPFLFRGNAKKFALIDEAGKGVLLTLPFGYQQLQDNREWKTNGFAWMLSTQLPGEQAGVRSMTIGIGAPTP